VDDPHDARCRPWLRESGHGGTSHLPATVEAESPESTGQRATLTFRSLIAVLDMERDALMGEISRVLRRHPSPRWGVYHPSCPMATGGYLPCVTFDLSQLGFNDSISPLTFSGPPNAKSSFEQATTSLRWAGACSCLCTQKKLSTGHTSSDPSGTETLDPGSGASTSSYGSFASFPCVMRCLVSPAVGSNSQALCIEPGVGCIETTDLNKMEHLIFFAG
jgi:hypothetical protein